MKCQNHQVMKLISWLVQRFGIIRSVTHFATYYCDAADSGNERHRIVNNLNLE